MRRLISIVVLSAVLHVGLSARPKSAILDSLMHELAARGQFSGSVLVAEHGEKIYSAGFGLADASRNLPFDPKTPCYLASLSKQFTAMAVMMLQEAGKISYSDRILKYFPDFPSYAAGVTIRNLLNHTSGIVDYVALGLERPGLTNRDVYDALRRQDSLDFPPGSMFDYSNSNYVLLALIIEKVTGEKYGQFLKERIFEPLGMEGTFVLKSAPHPAGIAGACNRFGDDEDYDLLTYGEGGIYSTVEDLFRWDRALYTDRLVRSATLQEAFKGATLAGGGVSNYGFGWGLGSYEGDPTLSHAGRYGGFNTYIKRFPKAQNTVIFLTNRDFKNMSGVGNAIIAVLFGERFVLPKMSIADSMYALYKSKGLAAAIQAYHAHRDISDTLFDYSESELNELGYEFIGQKKYREAVEILKLNADQYPASANAYDSLGEAYADDGQTDLAVNAYRKSLDLNPRNTNAAGMLKKLRKHY